MSWVKLLQICGEQKRRDTPVPSSFSAWRNALLEFELSLGGHNQVFPTHQPLTMNSESAEIPRS
jgi:hypothetical protein